MQRLPEYFQQDGAPSHYATAVREWLSDNFDHWIGRRGDVEWAPWCLDLTPLDILFWGHLKKKFIVKRLEMSIIRENTF